MQECVKRRAVVKVQGSQKLRQVWEPPAVYDGALCGVNP